MSPHDVGASFMVGVDRELWVPEEIQNPNNDFAAVVAVVLVETPLRLRAAAHRRAL